MTQHPSQQERHAIQTSADAGDESARNYLELLDACIQVLEASNGISLARGMVGEHNDVYGHAIDDALSDLMPVMFRCCAGGWDSLKWYVPKEVQEKEVRHPLEALQSALEQQRKYEAENWPFADGENKPTGTGESITYHLASLYSWSPEYVLTLPPEARLERLKEVWRSFSIAGSIIKCYEDAATLIGEEVQPPQE